MTDQPQRLYVYTITIGHLDLIDGPEGQARLAHILGLDAPLTLAARHLTGDPGQVLRSTLTDTFGLPAADLAPHAAAITTAQGYAVFITSTQEPTLAAPPATSGLTTLFTLQLPSAAPTAKPPMSDARMGGMVATVALLLMFAFMLSFILIGS